MNWNDANKLNPDVDYDGVSNWMLIWFEDVEGLSEWDLGQYNAIDNTWRYWEWQEYEKTSKVTHWCEVEKPKQ